MTGSNSSPSERTLKLIDAALNLQQAGEAEQALQILLKAQDLAPEYAPVALLIGLAHRDAGRVEEAEESLRRAIDLDRENEDALQSLGLLLARESRSSEAVALLKRHAELRPGETITLMALASELTRLRRHDEAIRHYEQAWRKTQDSEIGVAFGRYLIRIQEWTRAEEVLRQAASAAPEPTPLAEWAYSLVLLGKHDEAVPILARILQIDPSFDRAWRGTSSCYLTLGQLPQALEAAERALAINVHHYRNWLTKADALLGLGQFREAMEAAEQGKRLIDPDDEEARPVLCELWAQGFYALVGLKQTDSALEYLHDARDCFPTEERFVRYQASYLAGGGEFEAALRVLDEAQQAGVPASSNLVPLRFEVLHALGRPDDAWAVVESQLGVYQERRLDLLAMRGVSLYARGFAEPGRAVFEQLHSFAPSSARFSSTLGFMLLGEGSLAEAKRLFQKSLDAPDGEAWQPLVLANLGYMGLIEGEFESAQQTLDDVASMIRESPDLDVPAALHVAYWVDGSICPDPVTHPITFQPISVSVRANLVALNLADGQADDAEALAREIIEEAPGLSLGHAVVGTVLFAQGLPDEARRAWRQARDLPGDPDEQQALSRWLDLLPD